MKNTLILVIAAALMSPVVSLHAAKVVVAGSDVDCSKKSLQVEIDKLDKTAVNALNIYGNCNETIVVDGHADLTLIGVDGASITAAAINNASPSPLTATGGSKIRVENLTLNGGGNTFVCNQRSSCTLFNVTSQDGFNGIAAQDQSGIDVIGASSILNSTNPQGGTGIGVYGASSVNVQPDWSAGFVADAPAALISGHGTGVFAQDGSFVRMDNATVSENEIGIVIQRNATLKVISNSDFDAGIPRTGEVSNNTGPAIIVRNGSSAQILAKLSGNGNGVYVGALSYAQVFSEFSPDATGNVQCTHPTAVTADDQSLDENGNPVSTCP